jgi:hypothetical protein
MGDGEETPLAEGAGELMDDNREDAARSIGRLGRNVV